MRFHYLNICCLTKEILKDSDLNPHNKQHVCHLSGVPSACDCSTLYDARCHFLELQVEKEEFTHHPRAADQNLSACFAYSTQKPSFSQYYAGATTNTS